MLTAMSQKGLPLKNGKRFNYLLVLLYVYVICFRGKGVLWTLRKLYH